MAAAQAQGVRRVSQRHRRPVEPAGDPRALAGQRGRSARRHRDHGRFIGGWSGRTGIGGLQHDVGIGPRQTEGADARVGAHQGLGRQRQAQGWVGVEPELGVDPPQVRLSGHHPVLEHQHRLEEAGESCPGLEVAHHRLDRAQVQRSGRLAVGGVHGGRGPHLDGISQRGAGAMALQQPDLVGVDAGVCARRGEHLPLSGAVGDRQPAGCAVVVDVAAPQDRVHPVAISMGVGQALDRHHHTALGPHVAIGLGGEGLAASVRGQGTEHRQPDRCVGVDDGVDSPHQRDVAPSAPHRRHRLVQCHQRRRAGGLNAQGRAVQAQRMADASGGEAGLAAGSGERLGGIGRALGVEASAVVGGADAHEHPHRLAAQSGGGQSSVFEGEPGLLEEQALLGIEAIGLCCGDAEVGRVEAVDPVDEATASGDHPTRGAGHGVVPRVGVEPIAGHRLDAIFAAAQRIPQPIEVVDPAGKATRDAHDGDRLAGCGSRRGRGDRPRRILLQEVPSQSMDGGMVEHCAHRERTGEAGLQAVAQVDGGQRVHARVEEPALGVDPCARGQVEGRARLGLHVVAQHRQTCVGRRRRQGCGEGCQPGVDARPLEIVQSQPLWPGAGEAGPVEGGHQDVCWRVGVGAEGPHHGLAGQRGVDLDHPLVGPPSAHRGRNGARQPRALPGSEGQGGAGQAQGVSVSDQRVRGGVGGRVRALTLGSEPARRRGHDHEEVQAEAKGRFVQRQGTCELGAERRVHVRGGGGLQRGVGAAAGGVHHALHVAQIRREPSGGLGIAHVEGRDLDAHPSGLQRLHVLAAGCVVGTAATGEHQGARSTGHQPARDLAPDGTEGAGDPHGAVGVEARVPHRRLWGGGQAGGQSLRAGRPHQVFVAGEAAGDDRVGVDAIAVDDPAVPGGLLVGEHPHPAMHGCADDPFSGRGPHDLSGDREQGRGLWGGMARAGQPPARQLGGGIGPGGRRQCPGPQPALHAGWRLRIAVYGHPGAGECRLEGVVEVRPAPDPPRP